VRLKQSVRKPGLDRNAIPEDYASRQCNHLIDCRIEIKTLLSRRRRLDVLTDAVDDVSGSIDIANDTGECLPDLAQVRRLRLQKILGRTGVVARAGDRLRDFVSQRGSQFSHYARAVHVREVCLEYCPVCQLQALGSRI
jgi:hypothetical protein